MKKEYKFNFLRLKYLIKAKYNNQEDLAKELNITLTSLSNKLNNRTPFSYNEIFQLIDLLEISDKELKEVFFKVEC